MSPQILRFETLPESFPALLAVALAEGHAFPERLRDRWRNGAYLDDANAALMGVLDGAGALIAIGAQTADQYDPHPDHRRLRHFYVMPSHRRTGVGRALAGALIQDALDKAPILHLRASSPVSIAFWNAMGFEEVKDHPDHTHRMTRG
jgi:GNAT superfamily N-acetyltransferase